MILRVMLWEMFSTMLIAMMPVVELRGAIPYGVALDLPLWLVYTVALVGNFLPVPFIILFARRIFTLLKKMPHLGELIASIEKRAHMKGRLVNRYKTLGLYILVAIPLPGTGAWTGALVAGYLDIRLRNALPAIAAGLVTAGAIVICVSYSALSVFN